MSSTEKFRLVNVGELYVQLADELSVRSVAPELPITSLPKLNEKMWGIRKRKLTVIGARTSQGKTSLAVQFCYDLAMQDKSVVFLSLEMENIECAERLLAHHYQINNRDLLKGQGDMYRDRAISFGEKMMTKKFIISDCIGRTWQEIDELVKNWHSIGKIPDVIILDYIQNIKLSGNTQKEQIDEYIRHFREMAIRYNFAGVLCSQINRTSPEAEDKIPQLHQLKGTGFLEEHADIVMLLHWPYFYDRKKGDKNHFELYLAKNKLGETGKIEMRYYPQHFMFRDPQVAEPTQERDTTKERNMNSND